MIPKPNILINSSTITTSSTFILSYFFQYLNTLTKMCIKLLQFFPIYMEKTIKQLKVAAENGNVPFEFISKLLLSIDKYKFYTRGKKLEKDFDKILNQGWLHIENIKEGLKNED